MRLILARPEIRVVSWTIVLAVSASVFALVTARWLGASDRGVIVVFLTTSSFLMLIGSLGLGTGGRVLLHERPALELVDYQRYARILAGVHILTSATVGIGVLWASKGLKSFWIGAFFLPYAAALLYSYLRREALHGLGRHEAAVISDVVPAVTQTTCVAVLYLVGHLTLTTAMVSLAVGAMAQTAFLTAQLKRVLKGTANTHWPLKRVIKFSFPAMTAAVGQAFVIRGDRLILGIMTSTAAVGVYGAAATFTEMLWLLPGAIAQLSFRRASVSRGSELGRRVRRLTILLTACFAIALASVAPWLIRILLGRGYEQAIPLSYILIAAAVPMASFQLDASVLNGLGHLREGSRITMLGSLLLCAACVLLIPQHGAFGAAWASLLSYSIMAIATKLSLHRRAHAAGSSFVGAPL